MPDTPVDPTSPRSYPPGMESRVAVLEQIARTTSATLERMEQRIDVMGADVRNGLDQQRAAIDRLASDFHSSIERLHSDHRADFRWLLGVMLAGFGTLIGLMCGLLGVMAHGFHWL
ncbi:MAG: hypothetical protein ABI369_09015 [Acetobacteraceae bacterium]